ncbi:MAG: 6-phosphofructokinase, partial [Chloroflexi bacterium]|nr:6-phosphofructokinase [Chloroflexota bacterium]
AIRALARGEKGVLTGLRGNQVVTTPLDEVVNTVKPLDAELAELARIMAI